MSLPRPATHPKMPSAREFLASRFTTNERLLMCEWHRDRRSRVRFGRCAAASSLVQILKRRQIPNIPIHP